MKHFYFRKLFLALLLMIAGNNAFAWNALIDGIYYEFDGDEAMVTEAPDIIGLPSYSELGESLVIPPTVTYEGIVYKVTGIGVRAFVGAPNINSISLPNSVITIGEGAFETTQWYQNQLDGLVYVGQVAYKYKGKMPENAKIVIKDGTRGIADDAFNSSTSLTSISLPSSLISIGEVAFVWCNNLIDIAIPNSVTRIGRNAFRGTAWYDKQPDGIVYAGSVAYGYKGTLSENMELDIKDGTIGIADGAFASFKELSSVTLPESMTNIGNEAFSGCTGLTSITIPDGVKRIGSLVFQGCSSLKALVIPESMSTISRGSFAGCSGLTSITIPESVTIISDDAFFECSGLISVNLPEHLSSLGSGAFRYCSALQDINIPSSLNQIKHSTFLECGKLNSLSIPHNIKLIEGYAFYNCISLNEITIPQSVDSIGEYAFTGCDTLMTVAIKSQPIVSKDLALWNIFGKQVTSYVLGEGITKIGANAFAGGNVQSVDLPDGIINVSKSSFDLNTDLKVNRGCKTLVALWGAGFEDPVEKVSGKVLAPTKLILDSCTQTSASFFVDNVYPEYTTTCDDMPLKSSVLVITGQRPDYNGSVLLKISEGDVTYSHEYKYVTKSLNLATKLVTSPTTFTAIGSYEEEDAIVIAQRMEYEGTDVDGNEFFINGLEPKSTYNVNYIVTVSYGEESKFQHEYTQTTTVKTNSLELKTLPPKVISLGEVIVAAESNIEDDEEKVGFEWRRTDAPDEVASRSGEAYLYEGTMEGYIHNLNSFNYWRYRPYYLSTFGNKFYGDWGIVEADDYSYFEPTVHTYAKIEVEGNSAEVKGYATRGSDEVTEQGFMYWEAGNEVKAEANGQKRVPSNAKTIAASGQVMTASITNLAFERTYNYVAYMKTSKGQTYYGELQSFTTGNAPVGIPVIRSGEADGTSVTVDGRYDLSGRKVSKPVKGMNLLRKSDGTTKKVYVK